MRRTIRQRSSTDVIVSCLLSPEAGGYSFPWQKSPSCLPDAFEAFGPTEGECLSKQATHRGIKTSTRWQPRRRPLKSSASTAEGLCVGQRQARRLLGGAADDDSERVRSGCGDRDQEQAAVAHSGTDFGGGGLIANAGC